MATNRLKLRTTISPYTFPYPDMVKGSTLSWGDVDNNFIFLKGMALRTGFYNNGDGTLTLTRIDGTNISISGLTSGATGVDVYVTGGTYSNGSATLINNTGGTFTLTGFTTGTTTSAAGSNTQVQWNDNGSFGANSGFTYDPSNRNKLTVISTEGTSGSTIRTNTLFVGSDSNIDLTGATGMIFNNSQNPNKYAVVLAGDLEPISFEPQSTYLGYLDTISGDVRGFYSSSAQTMVEHAISDDNIDHRVLMSGNFVGMLFESGNTNQTFGLSDEGAVIEVESPSGQTAQLRLVVDSNDIISLSDTSGVTFYNTYSFPSSDGSNNQVLQTDGNGVVSWGTVSGSTGSTSPAGSDTNIQFNDNGAFGANTGLTYNSNSQSFRSESLFSAKTSNISSGKVPFLSTSFVGNLMSYKNPSSGGTTTVGIGDLTTVGGGDNATIIGYFNPSNNEQYLVTTSTSQISLVSRDASTDYTAAVVKVTGFTTQLNTTSGTSLFDIVDSGGSQLFSVNSDGLVRISNAFNLPTSDGSSNQVLQTDGNGVVSWATTSGTADTSLFITGSGTDSTQRKNVNNLATGNYSAALGGSQNTASSEYTTIAGGCNNSATATYSTIGGGVGNCGTATTITIAGGCGNTASGGYTFIGGGKDNTGSNTSAVVVGGANNTASALYTSVLGGCNNVASGNNSVVGGGVSNTATTANSVVGGGNGNSIPTGGGSTIGGGVGNTTSALYSTISGGYANEVGSTGSAIGGGTSNEVEAGVGGYSTISGGYSNFVHGAGTGYNVIGGGRSNCLESGAYNGILGGCGNTVTGTSTSFIVGADITADRSCTTFVNNLSIMDIPTSDPSIVGAVWSDSGTLKISSGGAP